MSDDSYAKEFRLHTITVQTSLPIMVTRQIEDKLLPMELDSLLYDFRDYLPFNVLGNET